VVVVAAVEERVSLLVLVDLVVEVLVDDLLKVLLVQTRPLVLALPTLVVEAEVVMFLLVMVVLVL
jgi:hypothetical protein